MTSILIALYKHFHNLFTEYKHNNGQPHPDAWTLYFLSGVECEYQLLSTNFVTNILPPQHYCAVYGAIGERIDEDASGFISAHEVINKASHRYSSD